MKLASQTKPKYPFAPLAALMGMSESQACRMLGISGKTQQEYRRDGMSAKVADRMAVKARFHPYEVWPVMADRDVKDVEHVDYKEAAARRKRRADYRRRRYQTDPREREARKAAAARYRAETAEYKRRQDAAYRAANRDRRIAAERERYRRNRDAILAAQRERRRRSQQPDERVA